MTVHMRSKSCHCMECGATGYVTANLDTGKITEVDVPPICKHPAVCPERFVRGIFDRQFGSRIVRPTPLGPENLGIVTPPKFS